MDKLYFESIDKLALATTLSALDVNTNKGLVAIVVAQDGLSASQNNGIEVAKHVEKGVIQSGFNAKTYFAPVFPCVTNENRYNIQLREETAYFVQRLADSGAIDAFVFVASNVFSIFGMLKGAFLYNIPCLFVTNGCMTPIEIEDKKYDLTSLNGIAPLSRRGKVHPSIFKQATEVISQQVANDTFCYETNCGGFLMQALGFALPDSVGVVANRVKHYSVARKTGEKICQMAELRLTSAKMLNVDALKMALSVDLALGGSPVSFVNIAWLSKFVGEQINLKILEKLAQNVPQFKLSRSGFDVTEFESNGGIFALINNICNSQIPLTANYLCFDNKKMIDFCKAFDALGDIPTKEENQKSKDALKNVSAVVLSGNIANSAISFSCHVPSFVGNAKVFTSEDNLVDAILNNDIQGSDCIVLTYCGAKGGLFSPVKSTAMLKALGLSAEVAFVTDGVVPHYFDGLAVSLVYPEAYEESPLAYVKTGDKVEINLAKSKINIDINAKEFKIRRKQTETKQILSGDKNYFYSKFVTSPETGCAIDYSIK